MRVAAVDDHPVARFGLAAILGAAPDMEVVAVVADPAELPRDAGGAVAADVVIVDLYLTGVSPALDVIADVSAGVPVLVVSASQEPADVLAAMQAGASGYLTKRASEGHYLSALRSVRGGGFHLSAQLADLIHAATRGIGPATTHAELSAREREVLAYIARGFTHQQTATRMGVSAATVNTYVVRIRAKLGLGNKAELALAALRYLAVGASRG
jgi:two-component system, NarL family, nitrate/nitrite response regulator NarL